MMWSALANETRRETIKCLESVNGHVEVERLADRLATTEKGDSRTVQISLLHNHLPKLESAGIVEVDDGTIHKGPRFQQCSELLHTGEQILKTSLAV